MTVFDMCTFRCRVGTGSGDRLCCCELFILNVICVWCSLCVFFFQAEDGIRDLVRSRGLGDVYKRQQVARGDRKVLVPIGERGFDDEVAKVLDAVDDLSLIHI